jgi:hypothetical protein
VPQEKQICRADAEHHDRMSVQPIQEPAPPGQRQELAHGQRIDIADSAPIEIARTRMVEGMRTPPEVVRRQRQHADDAPDPIVRETMTEE